MPGHVESSHSRWRLFLGGALIAGIAAGAGCAPDHPPGSREEDPKAIEEVPAAVREGAEAIARRLGQGHCEAWFWDRETRDWECRFVGLSRQAELDILPDGRFSELELVYRLDEFEPALKDEAAYISDRCRNDPGVFIELSLRREEHLDPIPELSEAWSKDGVVLEFQCPNGVDYEIDARKMGVIMRVDDRTDAPAGPPPPE